MKRLRYTISLLWLAAAAAVASDAVPDGKPVLKVAYGDYYGIAPLVYSYAVWPNGQVQYAAAASKDNAVKTRGTKMLRTTPEKVIRAVNRLLDAGFLSLRSEVHTFMATLEAGGQVSLDRTIATHSQELTLEFHFENENHKIVVSRSESFPWITAPLKEIESEIGIRQLVE
jgi:hypothetical protein